VRPEAFKAIAAGPDVAAKAVTQIGLIFALCTQRSKQSVTKRNENRPPTYFAAFADRCVVCCASDHVDPRPRTS
jgi:hypothetical protein